MKKGRGRMSRLALGAVLVCVAAAGAALAGVAVHASTMPVRVKVTETNYRLTLSKHSFKPGKVEFIVTNHGTVAHEFAIRGPGLNKRISGKVMPGKTRTLTVQLRKGTYTLDCPIHVALGMKATIHVGTSSGTTTSGTTTGGGGWG